jgi:hypothetical protein
LGRIGLGEVIISETQPQRVSHWVKRKYKETQEPWREEQIGDGIAPEELDDSGLLAHKVTLSVNVLVNDLRMAVIRYPRAFDFPAPGDCISPPTIEIIEQYL